MIAAVLFGPPVTAARAASIVFSELMYDPLGGSDFEFIEVHNQGTNDVNLHGARFTEGIDYTFTNVTLRVGGYVVVPGDYASFTSRYPSVTNALRASHDGKLANEGERVTLEDSGSVELYSARYNDSSGWPEWAMGLGSSLVLCHPDGNPDSATNWCASDELHGSPGEAGSCAQREIRINEVLAHTDPPLEDAIELYNRSGGAVDLSGWYLSDDRDVRDKYRITNTVIAAGGYAVFYEYQFGDTNDTNNIAFALQEGGDEVYLTAADGPGQLTRFVDRVEFGASDNGVAFGLYPNGSGAVATLSHHTFGVTNPSSLAEFRTGTGASNAYPRVGPVVISEIMYHPPDTGSPPSDNDQDEYVELCNVSGSPLPLYDPSYPSNTWKLTSAVSYDFPTNITMAAGEYILVVGATNEAAFRATYGLANPAVRVFGPWSGKLDNSSESVRLRKPGDPETNLVPYVLVEQVDYRDDDGWPPGPDGYGHSLERTALIEYGNDPANWHVGLVGGSPGATNSPPGEFPPVATVSAARVVFEQTACGLDGSDSFDPEGSPLVHAWSQAAGPAGTFSATTTATTVFTVPAVTADTNVTIELVVTDDRSYSATASVEIAVINAGVLAQGTLSANTTWTSGDSPVGIVSNVTVAAGVTLTIQQGTEVLLNPGMSLVTLGGMQASGSAGQKVVFDCVDTGTCWGTIGFAPGATGVLRHCELRRGSSAEGGTNFVSAICAYKGKLTVVECLAEDMSNICFYANRCEVLFQSNVVRRTGEGINVVQCSAILKDNRFSFIRNDGDGIDVDSIATPDGFLPHPVIRIARNVIWAITGDGIDLGDVAGLVDGNLVFHCGDKGLSLGEGSSPVMMNNLVWGCRLGLAIKDESNPTVLNHTLVKNRVGVSCYENEKNPGAGGGKGRIFHSIIWSNDTSVEFDELSLTSIRHSIVEGDPSWWGEGNTNADPLFASTTNMDFRLSAASPGAEHPCTNNVPDHDLVWTPRPQGAGSELGALERTAAATDVDRDGVTDASDAFVVDHRYWEDQDGDGLPDAWEIAYFGDTNEVGTADYDGDGADNRTEYEQGSNPTSTGNRDIIINEIHYHPESEDEDDEFVELHNRGPNTIDLSGWSLTDEILFHFPPGTTIGPGEYLVVAADRGEMEGRVRGGSIVGDFRGPLGDGAGILRLNDDQHYPVDAVLYDTVFPWPHTPNGFGPSLERCDAWGASWGATNWKASLVFNGTPGRSNSVGESSVVINEVLAVPTLPGNDWLELYNRGTGTVSLAGCYLSDDIDELTKYEIPGGTSLTPSNGLQFTQAQIGFGFLGTGEDLYLTASDGHTILSQVEYGPQTTNVSWGRYPNGVAAWYFYSTPTPAATNPPPPHTDVVINELMYHPDEDTNEDGYEYVELYNRGGSAADLTDWRMGDGFDYVFPTGASIAAGAYLVVGHDVGLVEGKYGLSGVLGPFLSGKLANGGERLALADALGNVVDEVVYGDRHPWPDEADGGGPSLELIHPGFDNYAYGAWRASRADTAPEGTPGAQNSVFATNAPPVVTAVAHASELPRPGEAIEVLAQAGDGDDSIASVRLYWKLDGAATWSVTDMVPVSVSGAPYGAPLGGFGDSNVVLYYVEAADAASNTVVSPPGAPTVVMPDTTNETTKTYLCLVDATVYATNLPLYRLLTSATNWSELAGRDPYSNELLDGTLLVGDMVYRNIGYRFRGQLRSDYNTTTKYNLRLDLGRREVHGDDELDISNSSTDDDEYLAAEFFQRVGFPCYEVRPVRLLVNAGNRGYQMELEQPDEDMMARYHPEHAGEDGLMAGWFVAMFGYYSQAAYNALQTPAGPGYEPGVEAAIDADQWCDWFATTIVMNNWDTLLRAGSAQNMLLYYDPDSGLWQMHPIDLDTAFPPWFTTPIHDTNQASYVYRFVTWPTYRRRIYERVFNLLDGPFAYDKMQPWMSSVYAWMGGARGWSPIPFVTNRAIFLEGYIGEQIAQAFTPGVPATVLWRTNDSVAFTGTVATAEIPAVKVNGSAGGVSYPDGSPCSWGFSTSGLAGGPHELVVAALPVTNRSYQGGVTVTVHVLTGDYDGDTIADQDEGSADSDGDGAWDYQDTDSDNDGFADSEEAGDGETGTPPADTDNDGVPDYLDDDSDGDGFPDSHEHAACTGRADSNSYLAVRHLVVGTNAMSLSWPGATTVIYAVECSSEGSWRTVASNLVGVLGTNTWEDAEPLTGTGAVFRAYRLLVQ